MSEWRVGATTSGNERPVCYLPQLQVPGVVRIQSIEAVCKLSFGISRLLARVGHRETKGRLGRLGEGPMPGGGGVEAAAAGHHELQIAGIVRDLICGGCQDKFSARIDGVVGKRFTAVSDLRWTLTNRVSGQILSSLKPTPFLFRIGDYDKIGKRRRRRRQPLGREGREA
jgi:hypothetical protein